ncbi:citramalyl-CoA lyase, mitochondrial isoform X4 [Chiloscyllium plagiosum]|uniref:citramalyl-CoA lyase, mitochondrial isoform X4 n=1 Tax=Chiloscyllium plagiosum TaxID=36176 RepID=UPI001CB83062|nr:citramalyl-CoA lyase, mitochondrial isoform X4 [Chiloscyllium plagiosum]
MAAVWIRELLISTNITRWFLPKRNACFRTVDREIYLRNSAKSCSTLGHVECCHYTCSANTKRKYVPRRAVLYVPGNDERKLHKITSLDVDCAVLDCEDGVALNKKFADRFAKYSKGRTLKEPMNLITFVETAVGLLNFKAGCEEAQHLGGRAGFQLDGVVFGSDDFCASIGATRTKDAQELVYARQKVVVTAKAFGLQAIDLVYIDYKDDEGLCKQSREGALMGFTGKQVIHPRQIPIVQEAFSPSPERVKWARELIEAFEEYQKLGKGAFTFHGSMIDMPSLKQAQNIITLTSTIKET